MFKRGLFYKWISLANSLVFGTLSLSYETSPNYWCKDNDILITRAPSSIIICNINYALVLDRYITTMLSIKVTDLLTIILHLEPKEIIRSFLKPLGACEFLTLFTILYFSDERVYNFCDTTPLFTQSLKIHYSFYNFLIVIII